MLAMVRILAISMVVTLALIGTAMGDISRTGIIGEWHFDEGVGNNVKDSSGNGKDGIIKQAIWIEGKFGKALSFDGVDDYIELPNTTEYNSPSGITYEAWIKLSEFPPSGKQGWAVSYADSIGVNDIALGYDNGHLGNGFYFSADAIDNRNYLHGSIGELNRWYHLVGVSDYQNNKLFLYVNGVLEKSAAISGKIITRQMEANIGIGHKYWFPFQGTIDEVRIYRRALSPAEIKDNYEAGQITVTSTVTGAEVLLDGLSKGIASPTLILYGISPGPHTVQCRLSGYDGNDTSINLAAGSTASAACTLTLAPGSISVTSSPSGAEVYLDGTLKGTAPVMLNDVSPGNHVIWCKKSGYEDLQQSIDVTASETATSACDLKPANATPTLSPTPSPTLTPTPISTPTPSPTPEIEFLGTPTPISTPNPQSNSLTVMLTSEPLSIVPGQTSSITVAVTGQGGKEISGADVMLSSTGGKFSPISGQTNSFGQFTSTFTAPVEGKVVLKAKIRKEGFAEGSKELIIELNPTANQTSAPVLTSNPPNQDRGTNMWLIALVMVILLAAILIYFVYIKKKQKVSVAETKKKEVMDKKKFCMFCHAPMPFDAEFCPKCGKKQDETKRFCMNCGALMPAVPELCGKCSKMPPSGEDTKTCKNCGEVIPIVAKFCSACGAGQPE